MAFKDALNEPYLGIFDSWTGSDCCHNWFGISCDPTNSRVADINLRGKCEDSIFEGAHGSGYMSGQISSQICNLDRLSNLVVADWKAISSPIPPCITSLPFLRILVLVSNRISGPLPESIGNLARLTVLNVADNQISGRILPSLTNLAALMHLDLRNNRISGELPADLGKLKMLSRALLGWNDLQHDPINGCRRGR